MGNKYLTEQQRRIFIERLAWLFGKLTYENVASRVRLYYPEGMKGEMMARKDLSILRRHVCNVISILELPCPVTLDGILSEPKKFYCINGCSFNDGTYVIEGMRGYLKVNLRLGFQVY